MSEDCTYFICVSRFFFLFSKKTERHSYDFLSSLFVVLIHFYTPLFVPFFLPFYRPFVSLQLYGEDKDKDSSFFDAPPSSNY